MADAAKLVVRTFIDQVANGRDLGRLPDLLSDDFYLPIGDSRIDRDGLGAVLSYYYAAFPDQHYDVSEVISEGDTVVARARMIGTHTGVDYAGCAASGRSFAVDEVDTFRIVDGRIASYDIVWDELGFRRELGIPFDA
jgi:steroid delta-isomerase-like uncharacterized protein